MILLWDDKQSIWYYYEMINNQYDTTMRINMINNKQSWYYYDMINNQYDTTMTW